MADPAYDLIDKKNRIIDALLSALKELARSILASEDWPAEILENPAQRHAIVVARAAIALAEEKPSAQAPRPERRADSDACIQHILERRGNAVYCSVCGNRMTNLSPPE